MTEIRKRIFEQIEAERARQMAKWGDQSHKPDGTWALILGEEIGEWMRSCLEGDTDHAIEEMVQCLAVGTAWLEGRLVRQEECCVQQDLSYTCKAVTISGGRLGFGEGERSK